MMTNDPPPSELHDQVKGRLARHGLRYTLQRRAVVTSFQTSTGPIGVAQLQLESRRPVPISTIYRTLALLEQCNIVRRHHGVDGSARYELSEWLTEHHHHVVCVACGTVRDVSIDQRAEENLHSIAEGLGSQAGFRVLDHVLEVEGVCPECET